MGSSAGGHLASTLVTHFDAGKPDAADPIERQSSRPDLGILCYAVISMGDFGHRGSRNNLLGKDPSPELVRELSNELQVTKDTPPCFIWHTYEDGGVPVENSLQFAEALRKARVPFDLHVYQKGQHGLGLGHPRLEPGEEASLDARLHLLAAGAGVREVNGGVMEWRRDGAGSYQHSKTPSLHRPISLLPASPFHFRPHFVIACHGGLA